MGDQLLDVCGINLRNCDKNKAVLVLQSAQKSITMRVQFNPEEYHSMLTLASSHEDEDEEHEDGREDSSEDDSESDSEADVSAG